MTIYYAHETEQNVIDANSTIDLNCGFPNGRGTQTWAQIRFHNPLAVYYILKPLETGWNDGVEQVAQSQMILNVSDVTEQDFEPEE